jgi:hypothetical protein
MAQPLPIAGWYPDPEHGGQDRWWDGTGWTDTRRATGDAATPAAMPVVRNNMALIGFILSVSGFILPLVINSFAGGIVSIIGLRRSQHLAGTGILSNGRGLSIAGILIGFIWGGILLLFVAAFILFELWIFGIVSNVQYSDSPVV